MRGPAMHLILLQLCLAALVHSQPQCAMIIPNVLRVESEETVVVEVYNAISPIEVQVALYDFPQRRIQLSSAQISLNAANGYLGTSAIKIPAKDLPEEKKGKQFVYVTARSAVCQVEKVVLVHFHSGYIFIQTDKTIYTPGSSVYYRLFTMGHKLQPLSKTLIVEFVTPEGIIVKRDTSTDGNSGVNSGGIRSMNYKLPEIVNLGTWTIRARFDDSPQQNYSTQFDVKEYVLPSFEVIVEPSDPFFYLDGDELTVTITARFLYGKPVEGDALVLFGVIADHEKKSIPQSLRRIEIKDGHGEAKLTRKMLSDRFQNVEDLLGHSIYISVTVITSSGSDMVEAEKTDIPIVTSPYKVLFTKTPKYFKPGMPFDLMVFVTNPDGSPAHRIPVIANPGGVEGTTQRDGTSKLTINTAANIKQLPITVETKAPKLPAQRQARALMVATAYKPQGNSRNYLHIGVTANQLKPGSNLNVNFNMRNTDLNVQNQIKHFTYLIMSKGKIYKVGRQEKLPGQVLITMTLPITPEFIPSIRIIAYYYVANEIVSDSIWVDVEDDCMGTLTVSRATAGDNQVYEPGKSMKLKLTGDHKAKVGLVAVDKGVYVLNKKHKISQSKVWDSVEKNDIGCTPGSGANNVGVFSDAGLALETSFRTSTPQRSEPFCSHSAKRRRRSVVLIEYKAGQAAKYKGSLKKCCEDGMQDNLMGDSCQKRSLNIRDSPECVAAFLECCQEYSKLREDKKHEALLLSRSDVDKEYLSEDEVFSRTEFPESWLWKTEDLTEEPDKDGISSKMITIFLKDSITTWEVLAISLSENKGICVADPYEITVMKKFFIDLRLPYSVVRNEQVEIRAVLYNYENEEDEIKVRIELMYNEKFCSASTSKKKYRKELKMMGKTSKAVSFIIVPLEIGLHRIEVKAYVFNSYVADGVMKKLKVVAEGMKMNKTVTVITLDPVANGIDGVQKEIIKAANLTDIVPKTISETIVSVQGNPIAQLIESCIDGANLQHLIIVPYGCGEQNMITMTASVIATFYLDNTGQWEKLEVSLRSKAIKYIIQVISLDCFPMPTNSRRPLQFCSCIQEGYTQQLAYRQGDYSYAAFTHQPGSTWLTAYVVKIFAIASSLIDIQKDVLCGSVKWLILNKQKLDGVFREDQAVIHGAMMGGAKDIEPEASLTAFVLIALAESREICAAHVNSLEGSIAKAADFLERQYPRLTKPYAVAITAYALAMVNRLSTTDKLMAASTSGTHWNDPNRQFSIEASSYALLALVRTKHFENAKGIMRWLTEQKFYGGLYGSTQATVMVFQAMAQYTMDTPNQERLDLDISIKLPGRSEAVTHRISNEDSPLTRSSETKLNQDFTVEVKGTGQATLTVVTVYNAMLSEKEAICRNFDLSVTIRENNGAKRPEGAIRTVLIKVCTRYLGTVDATMTILDISMLTGFEPDINDLRREHDLRKAKACFPTDRGDKSEINVELIIIDLCLSEPVDKYISKFEIEKGLADKGKLILYMDKVSHTNEDCVSFNAHQYFEVGLIQPAAVTVYDYYGLDSRCTKFYHPDKESGLLSKICQGDVCRCAEESCYMQRLADGITVDTRVEEACAAGVDYVFKTRLSRTENTDNYDTYLMTIVEVIKAGSDEAPRGKIRRFISHQKCRNALKFEDGKEYLIWGINSDLWSKQQEEFSYIISKDTWIEWWPNEEECQEPKNEAICQEFFMFAETMMIFGCPN